MHYEKMSQNECQSQVVGEGITLTAVMAVAAIAVMAVVVYRLFMSSKGSTAMPGGFKFSWA